MSTYIHTVMSPDDLRFLASQLDQMNPVSSGSLVTEKGGIRVLPGQSVLVLDRIVEDTE